MNIRTVILCAALLPISGVAAQVQNGQSAKPTDAALAAAQAEADKQDLPPGWPRVGATLLVENDRGAAYNVTYEMGKPTAFHRHRYFFAGLDLNTASVSVKRPGETVVAHFEFFSRRLSQKLVPKQRKQTAQPPTNP
jgi:hypothetical protein